MNSPSDEAQTPTCPVASAAAPPSSNGSAQSTAGGHRADFHTEERLFQPPFRLYKGAVAIALATAFFLWAAPWHALEVGPDEGMVFARILLLLRHPDSAHLAWNDQPWFYSQLFASLFAATGFQTWIPRLATLAIISGLCSIFLRLMPGGAGWPHLLCAWLFFWSWPNVPHLSVSAMGGPPAFALSVTAAALLPRSRTEWRLWRFVSSGALLAMAVQIKWNAALVLPAVTVVIAWVWWQELRDRQITNSPARSLSVSYWWSAPIFGLMVFAVLLALIAWWSPVWDWTQVWGSHQSAGATQEAAKYRFKPQELLESPGTLAAALLGVIVLWRQRRLSESAFPRMLLASVLLVHLYHRPWWYYYGVHFAIPLAILGGWGAGELLRLGIRKGPASSGTKQLVFHPETSMMFGALAISLWMGFELSRAYEETWSIKRREAVADNEAVKVLKEYQGRVKWVFTRDNILAIHAGYVLPPELTILSMKRFWSGNATEEMVLNTVKRYRCEILILLPNMELKHEGWKQFTQKEYVNVWSDGNREILVAKRLNPLPKPDNQKWLKRMRL